MGLQANDGSLFEATRSANLPEFVVWRMTKDGRVAEARTRVVPLDDGRPEIRLYLTRSDGMMDLWWSMVLRDGHDVNELAQEKQREFEVQGWTLDLAAPADDHSTPPG